MRTQWITALAAGYLFLSSANLAWSQFSCADLPSHSELTEALKSSIAPTGGPSNGGFDFHMWAAVVNRDGEVCAITRSGNGRGDQFPISRVAAVFKATTANSVSLDGVAISTVLLNGGVQPGGSLFGLALFSPPDPRAIYPDPTGISRSGSPRWGTRRDPLVGKITGGFSAGGGGLPLYNSQGKVIGGLGVGGDTACADHNAAWRVRQALGLNNASFGGNPVTGTDAILYDYGPDGKSATGSGYPFCGFNEPAVAEEIGAGVVAPAQ